MSKNLYKIAKQRSKNVTLLSLGSFRLVCVVVCVYGERVVVWVDGCFHFPAKWALFYPASAFSSRLENADVNFELFPGINLHT